MFQTESRTILYRRWEGMKTRCYNKNTAYYKYYGERGILVCNEWVNSYQIFKDWALNNGFDPTLTLERRDTNKNYEPDNCYWATRATQQANRRKSINTKHQFIGVSQMKTGSWKAAICISKNQIHLGVFLTEDEAVDFRDNYIKLHKLPHKLNRS